MDQYIKQLLLLYSKVILPNLGAIVIANDETGELMFNEYLTYDDGKLSALLESESTMDLQEAKNSVAKYVRELELLLNKGETYSIFKLGEFRKTKDGSIEFEGNIKSGGPSASDPTIGPSPTPPEVSVSTPTPTEKVEKEKANEEPKPKITKAFVPPVSEQKEKDIPKEKVEETPQPKKDNIEPPVKKAVVIPDSKPIDKVVEPSKPKRNIYIEKEKTIDGAPIVEPIKEDQVPPIIVVEEKKRRRGFLFWFLLLLFLLILTGSIYVVTNYERVEEYMGWDDNQKAEEEAAEKARLEKKSAQAEAEQRRNDELNKKELLNNKQEEIEEEQEMIVPEEEPLVVEEKTQPKTNSASTSSGHHHIVIGCFSEKSNADGLVEKYKQKGYDSKIISELGGLYFVAAQSYPTLSEAKSELSLVRQDIENAWLFKQ